MFEGFTSFQITVEPNVVIHGIQSSTSAKPALLLLHGFPQTHHIWHRITGSLTQEYNVIALDLRGYGQSSKPASSDHQVYAKSHMARDCITVMDSLGFEGDFFICAHDRGARVAHKLCASYPEKVKKAIFLDICPTLATYEQTTMDFAKAYWHWFFLIQPEPFPERAILSDPDAFAEKFFGAAYAGEEGGGVFVREALQAYVAQLRSGDTVHAMCEDYRAAATVDLVEAREDLQRGIKIQCPLRVLWGDKGIYVKLFDVLKEWRAVSDGEVSGESVGSGHYIAEEVPDVLLKHITEFLV